MQIQNRTASYEGRGRRSSGIESAKRQRHKTVRGLNNLVRNQKKKRTKNTSTGEENE